MLSLVYAVVNTALLPKLDGFQKGRRKDFAAFATPSANCVEKVRGVAALKKKFRFFPSLEANLLPMRIVDF